MTISEVQTNTVPAQAGTAALQLTYNRIVLKVSGESLGTADPSTMWAASKPIVDAYNLGVDLALVIGGGNLLRGEQSKQWGIPRENLDRAGMLATAFNASLLSDILEASGVPTRIYSRGPCAGLGDTYRQDGALATISSRRVLLIAGGMGVAGISTDVAAAHLAADIKAEAIVMSKFGVDGVYDDDPRKSPDAKFLRVLNATTALDNDLAIMDREALHLARGHHIPIRVVPADSATALVDVLTGIDVGSTVLPL